MISVLHFGYSVGSVERTAYAAGPARGFVLNLGIDVADDFTASDESLYAATYVAQGYLQMPWRGDHTLALRSAGGMATGTFTRSTVFYVGGYNLEEAGLPDLLTSTVFNGAFVLRGYEPSTYRGTNYVLNNVEYRIPIAAVDRGIQTLPLFLRRIDGNLFVDWGGAWNRFDFEDVGFFEEGALVNSRQLHTGAGAELWFGIDLGYVVPINIRLGHAIGFSAAAIAGGQTYFLASSAY
jgi:outer membrane protein assembly factor BamA